MADPTPSTSSPLLRLLSDPASAQVIKQGAEAKVYFARFDSVTPKVTLPSSSAGASGSNARRPPALQPLLLKWRFPKQYRHPSLSTSITAQRTVGEARALIRCARYGVQVPKVVAVDEKAGVLALEWIVGASVRELLGGGVEADDLPDDEAGEGDLCLGGEGGEETEEDLTLPEARQRSLMVLVGHQLALMHAADVVHGDLTTSNMMVRSRANPQQSSALTDPPDDDDEIIFIDFGLSSVSSATEDKAVDIYVLERAFLSTHPNSTHLFEQVLESYTERVDELWSRGAWRKATAGPGEGTGKKSKSKAAAAAAAAAQDQGQSASYKSGSSPAKDIRKRLDEVRLRGRKRSMVG